MMQENCFDFWILARFDFVYKREAAVATQLFEF